MTNSTTSPDSIIDRILQAINSHEYTNSPYDLMEARRLLHNDLRQAVRCLQSQDSTVVAVADKVEASK